MVEVNQDGGSHQSSAAMTDAFQVRVQERPGVPYADLKALFGDKQKVTCEELKAIASSFGLNESSVDDFEGKVNVSAFLESSILRPLSEENKAVVMEAWDALRAGEDTVKWSRMAEVLDLSAWDIKCDFVGRYSDPNHAGGERLVTLLPDEKDGVRRAQCEGFGGAGEPEKFMLPVSVKLSEQSITVDFSVPPKGGPKDFVGTWDSDGIKWIKDGNKWPKMHSLTAANFLSQYCSSYSSAEGATMSSADFIDLFNVMAQGFSSQSAFMNFFSTCIKRE